MTALAARRRSPLASLVLVLLGLIVTGVAYSALAPGRARAAQTPEEQIAAGHALFLANCATCHGIDATGRDDAPSLVGVGAASVDFQVGTGRMPLERTAPQAPTGRRPLHPGADRAAGGVRGKSRPGARHPVGRRRGPREG